MAKLNRSFFDGNEVLFIGYSSRNKEFCKAIQEAMEKDGVKVYPLNPRSDGSFDCKVYKSFSELPKVPDTALIMMKPENTKKVVPQLKENGVKKILFQSKRSVDQETLNACAAMGIETAVGCPMMIFGSGLHKVHAFFAGVKR